MVSTLAVNILKTVTATAKLMQGRKHNMKAEYRGIPIKKGYNYTTMNRPFRTLEQATAHIDKVLQARNKFLAK